MRWFNKLKSSDTIEENLDSTALLDVYPYKPQTLLICHHTLYRRFTQFNDYFEFADYFFRCENEIRCFYEVILNNSQKPYFDLDIPLPNSNEEFSLNAEDSERAMLEVVRKILYYLHSVKIEDILILNSHGEKKSSYHIIVNNWCFMDNLSNKGFYQLITKDFPEKWKKGIDSNVYKTVQQFRIVGSQKFESNRFKVIDSNCKWKEPIKSKNQNHYFQQLLGASLVSNTSYCKILFGFEPLFVRKKFVGNEFMLDEENIKNALNLCAINENCKNSDDIEFPYELDKINGSLIELKRLLPSKCKICNKIHENQHPYLVVNIKGDTFFYCRRSDDNQRLHLGVIPIQNVINVPQNKEVLQNVFKDFYGNPVVQDNKTEMVTIKNTQINFKNKSTLIETPILTEVPGNLRRNHLKNTVKECNLSIGTPIFTEVPKNRLRRNHFKNTVKEYNISGSSIEIPIFTEVPVNRFKKNHLKNTVKEYNISSSVGSSNFDPSKVIPFSSNFEDFEPIKKVEKISDFMKSRIDKIKK